MYRKEIREYNVSRLTKPDVTLGVPETGLVGAIITSHLIDKLGLPEASCADSEIIPDSRAWVGTKATGEDLRKRRTRLA